MRRQEFTQPGQEFIEIHKIKTSGGNPIITSKEQQKVTDKTHKEGDNFHNLINNNADGIVIVDTGGVVIFVNPAAEEIFGRKASNFLGAQFGYPIICEETTEIDIVHKSKRSVVAEMVVVDIKWDGADARLLSIRDVTDRKNLEAQLQVRNRMDSLGTLAGGVAHDFNNLLTVIKGNVQLLSLGSDTLAENQKKYIESLETTCAKAEALIKQFQLLAQHTQSEKADFDIYEVISSAIQSAEETTSRMIAIKNRVEKDKYFVHSNESDLNQVFLNLLTNASQAIEKKGVKKGDAITISSEACTIHEDNIDGFVAGKYVTIKVQDTGSGMPEEVRSKAFDPLFSTKEKSNEKGAGLGLAMVYTLITKGLNGYVMLESTEGKGSTFHLLLPQMYSEGSMTDENAEYLAPENECILAIDDEESILELIRSVGECSGYNVTACDDGEDGIEYFKKNKDEIDIVLLDMSMPKMSGKTVFSKLLKIDPNVKVIICSGHCDDDIDSKTLSKAKGFLQKPFEITDLFEAFNTV